MKTLIAVLTSAAVLNIGTQSVSAGDREWATAGKILTGLVIGGAVARAVEPVPVYQAPPVVYAPAPVYVAPQVTYAPVVAPAPVVASAPVYVQPAPAPVVVYSPPPVYYVRPAPVYYCAPAPVVSFRFGFGGGYRHHRGRW